MSRRRHSPRTTNHNSPTPPTTFVRIGNTHSAGRRKPSTNTNPKNAYTFPLTSSGVQSSHNGTAHRRAGHSSHAKTAASAAAQPSQNTGHGRAPNGRMTSANSGEYRKASNCIGGRLYDSGP